MLKEIIDGINLSIFLILVLSFLVAVPVYLFGKSFETKYFPVVKNAKIEGMGVKTESHTYFYRLSFNKIRSCAPLKGTFAWYIVNKDGEMERIPYRDNIDNTSSLPKGINKIYVEVDNYKDIPFDSQRLVMTHYCHPLWITETILDFPVSSEQAQSK